MKKILIVTLSQGINYGGMLQAYALQESVRGLNLEVESTFSLGSPVKKIVRSLPGLSYAVSKIRRKKKVDSDEATQYTNKFIQGHITLVGFSKARSGTYAAYVVGSDQVWRKPYTYIPHNLLNFVKSEAPKISYAASFGRDDLDEYDNKLVARTKKLARRFDAISVREDSGVDIVKNYWGLGAEHHVDPTLLIDTTDYVKLIDNPTSELHTPDGDLFSYILDTDESKQGIASVVAKSRGLKVFTVIDGDENNGKSMPPVEQWLCSFRDAKYVVTDSFHGTVFSIIFNKPFIAIGNKERGLARFTSLLKMFGLEDRLVTSVDDVTEELINKPIGWNAVNAKIKSEQKRSFDYLKKHLR